MAAAELRPAIFLDRDGVINDNRPDHVKHWDEFRFLPGALEALRCLASLDWPVVVVTNQGMIGRGVATREAVEEIHDRMVAAVSASGGRIDAVYYCPHAPEAACSCRKPSPGLLKAAALELALDLSRSFMVGDAGSDVMAGWAAGCRPFLVLTGRGQQEAARLQPVLAGRQASAESLKARTCDVVADLKEATARILRMVEDGVAAKENRLDHA